MFKFTPISVAALGLLLAVSAQAKQSLQLQITIPRLQVAEYHKPYVAVWLEDSSRKAEQIAVWYDVEMKNNKGEEWLADLRQWWRRGGRSLELPIDGISGATKGPGQHELSIDLMSLKNKPAGEYKLRVEAAREVGGKELVQIPLTLPLSKTSLPITVNGQRELGVITLSVKN